ncbi:hypothetical protein N7462_007031 [Penicillium macrosclerotiorum]|uniref:uncharacterized protein n=1 Tax=Penicillium macrosclerotiorum TaxID=303699 RepID=UPI0025477862|nr:uncharacterized protein N7462_007031 [Penicillium macrosclerotiorum]KAJ5678787.1 hypothetical protein N7462_007031 [Penicillium macrosclerotiorum]
MYPTRTELDAENEGEKAIANHCGMQCVSLTKAKGQFVSNVSNSTDPVNGQNNSDGMRKGHPEAGT